jgi:hypothetical protein
VGVPAVAQPLHGVLDAVDVLLLLFLGIGVVEPHVADAAVLLRQAEVQADALGVAHVQVAVGFGREAGADARGVGTARLLRGRITRMAGPVPLAVRALLEVALDDLAQEIAGFSSAGGGSLSPVGVVIAGRF